MISKETIEQVLLRNDIETLIGSYVTLKRAGSNLKGLCPFHSEKTPSFAVYPADNSFYCFGCGVGGDAITFIRKRENLDYPDAVEFLANRAGITILRDENDGYSPGPKIDKAKILRMNVDAAKFFHKELFADTADAKAALDYFIIKRGLSISTIKHFGLGYAPNSFDAILKYMLAKGYTYEELNTGFLCGKNERGKYYDAFRNKVMFPIIDPAGNVIAFGGRVLDNSHPKYKNTSDTPVFKKSKNLFALNFAKLACEESLILCEGYMDVIALHAAGFTNAVATLGTAITAEQARLMSRYTNKVIICYDADEPGQKATARAIKILGDVGLDVTIIKIPEGKDPDDYIKANGADKFRRLLEVSKGKFDYSMDNILSKYDISVPNEKIKALRELTNLISETYSSAERDVYIQIVAKMLSVDFKSVKADVDRALASRYKARKKEESTRIRQDSIGYSDRINPDYAKAPAVAKNEEHVLGLILSYPEHRKTVFEKDLLSEKDFLTDLNRRIFAYIKNSYSADDDPMTLLNETFSEDEVGRITRMKISRMGLLNTTEVLLDSISSLRASVEKKADEGTSTIDALQNLINKKRGENSQQEG